MMMNTTGSTSRLAPYTANRQFFQWAVKWFYSNKAPVNTPTNPDLPSIIGLFQALGFKLREFVEKEKHIYVQDELKNENIQMVIQCGTSKMVAILEMDNVKCECPNNVTNDDSFWSITGTGPTLVRDGNDDVNKIEESGSNLLPEPSKEVTSVVRDITYKLFQMINNKGDTGPAYNSDVNDATMTKTTEIKEGLVRSYTDINDNHYKPRTMAIITSNLVSTKFSSSKSITKSQRRGTYDLHDRNENIDVPRPSPAKVASLPVVHQLCTSLGEISIESEDEIYNLAGYVVKAHQILDKAVAHIVKTLPISSSRSSVYEEGLPIKPAAPPLSNGGFKTNGSMKKKSNSGSSASSQQGSASSLSSRTTSSSDKISSKDKSVTKRNAGTRSLLPVVRDRAASCGSVPKTLALTANARCKVATPKPSTAQRSTTSSVSKLPTSKSRQIRTANHLTVSERGMLLDKKSPAAHGHVSLIKPPSRTPKLSTSVSVTNFSKFGYSTQKK